MHCTQWHAEVCCFHHTPAGSATASGVHASGTGTLCRIATSALYRNATCGAHAASGATLELSACAMYNNLQSGGHVSGTASLMVLAGGSIIKNGLHGLHADAGGILRAGKVLLAANARDGVALDGAGSHGSVRGCMVLDNREGGVTVTGSAHASVEDSKLSGNDLRARLELATCMHVLLLRLWLRCCQLVCARRHA